MSDVPQVVVVTRRKKSPSDLNDPNKGFPFEDVEEYKGVFKYFDSTDAGLITSRQLGTTLRSLKPMPNENHVRQQIWRVDENLHGVCSFEYFLESIHTTIRAANKRQNRKSMYTNISEERKSEIREAFDMFDYDNDETISLDELQTVLSSCGIYINEEEAQDILNEFGTEQTGGNLTFEDFLILMSTKESGEVNSEIKEAFKFFDKDGDGTITGEEVKAVMAALGEELTDNEISEMIKEADSNGNGCVCYEDFLKMITGN